MKKVLVLNGSPKSKSDTMVLTNSFLQGFDPTNYEIEIVDVINKNIQPCHGCLSCWQKADGHCIFEDDQNAILDMVISADIILWSFPLYAYGMPSHLKAVVDRLMPLSCQRMIEENGRVRHETIADFSQKKMIVISGCGFPNWEKNFDAVRIMCNNCFRDPTIICMPEAPMMNAEAAKVVADPKREAFFKAGREYSTSLKLEDATIKKLEEPMIPNEQYLAIVNGV